MKHKLVLLALAVAALSSACAESTTVYEFNCEKDGELSERHVGVERAYGTNEGSWSIRYTDGQTAVYVQQRGESCFTFPVSTVE